VVAQADGLGNVAVPARIILRLVELGGWRFFPVIFNAAERAEAGFTRRARDSSTRSTMLW
jgi:hypothetical protein